MIRLAGEEAEQIRPQIESALREALAEFDGPDGVVADASTWIVSAKAPASPPRSRLASQPGCHSM